MLVSKRKYNELQRKHAKLWNMYLESIRLLNDVRKEKLPKRIVTENIEGKCGYCSFSVGKVLFGMKIEYCPFCGAKFSN